MKKILKCVFLFLIMIPVLVNASGFGDAKRIANGYYKKFLTPERYLVSSTEYWALGTDGKPAKKSGFSTGGLITKTEIDLTRKSTSNPMSFSYIYDGTKIWTIEGKIVSDSFIDGSDAKTKVTEYVLHDTKVKGTGTYDNPWVFVDSYRVTVTAVDHGKIDGQVSSKKPVIEGGEITFNVDSDSGYIYLDNTCGIDSSYNSDTGVLTISNVSKDMECTVLFNETKYNYQFPTPCKKVTTSKYGERNHCFSNASPRSFYVNYLKGYFSDVNFTKRLGQITKPSLTGWVFDRFKVGSTTLVDSSGVFETNYNLFNDSSTNDNITYEIHEKTYSVSLDFQDGTGGTSSLTATYDHDVPSVTAVPRKPGYVFIGYYKTATGGDKYLNGQGKADSSCEPWNQDVTSPTIFAQYRKCQAGYKCPNGNDETPCPVAEYQNEEGKTTCKPCPAGRYNNQIGQTICPKCEPGYYQPDTGKTKCIACGTGQYQNEEGQTSCKPCPAGHYNNQTGQATCPCCPGGQYQGSTGQTSCLTCGKGTYSGRCSTSCTDCAAGTYQPSAGQPSCIPCPAGMYNTGTRLTLCHNCPAGKYQDKTGQTTCNSCASGYYSQAGAAICTICPEGTYSTDNGVGCNSCVANNYCTRGISNPCPSGYSSPAGSSSKSNCWRTRFTRTRYYKTQEGSCKCKENGCGALQGTVGACDEFAGTCSGDKCVCGGVAAHWSSGSCYISDWKKGAGSYVYGICIESGSTMEKYECSTGSTVYWPN